MSRIDLTGLPLEKVIVALYNATPTKKRAIDTNEVTPLLDEVFGRMTWPTSLPIGYVNELEKKQNGTLLWNVRWNPDKEALKSSLYVRQLAESDHQVLEITIYDIHDAPYPALSATLYNKTHFDGHDQASEIIANLRQQLDVKDSSTSTQPSVVETLSVRCFRAEKRSNKPTQQSDTLFPGCSVV